MTDHTYSAIVETRSDAFAQTPSAVSWAAIAAGAAANVALTLLLLSLGIGLGLSVVSPWGGGASPTTFKIGAGLYFIVVAMIASAVGGHIAGRLRTRWTGLHTDEVFFRDTAHGFLAWAFAAIVGVSLLSAPTSIMIGGASEAMQRSAGTTATSPADRYIDRLLRRDAGAAPTTSGGDGAGRSELIRYLTSATAPGATSAAEDRADVARFIAARAGISEADANGRLDAAVTRMKSDADAARKAAASLALWLTGSMLLGAFASALAATEGGRTRDHASPSI